MRLRGNGIGTSQHVGADNRGSRDPGQVPLEPDARGRRRLCNAVERVNFAPKAPRAVR